MSTGTKSLRLRALALLAACVAILGIAACGGSDDTTSSTTSSTTVPTGATGASSTSTTADSTSSGDTTDLPSSSQLRDAFNTQLLQVLTQQQGLTQSQAQCAIDKLDQAVSDQELTDAITQAAQSGQPPKDLLNEAFNAGKACANQ